MRLSRSKRREGSRLGIFEIVDVSEAASTDKGDACYIDYKGVFDFDARYEIAIETSGS